jgi:hypothetical protein
MGGALAASRSAPSNNTNAAIMRAEYMVTLQPNNQRAAWNPIAPTSPSWVLVYHHDAAMGYESHSRKRGKALGKRARRAGPGCRLQYQG